VCRGDELGVTGSQRGVLVVPVYNEADRFDPTYWRQMREKAHVRVHFVNDGSDDGSPALLDDLCREAGFTVTHLQVNQGKANAVRLGLVACLKADPEVPVGFIDADGVFGADDVAHLLSLLDHDDLRRFEGFFSSRVALSGRNIERRTSRHYIGRAVATVLSAAYTPMPYDSQSGLKFFRPSPVLLECLEAPFTTRWFFEMELLIRWRQATGEAMLVWEEPVQSWFDAPGSKISGRETLRVPREIYRVISLARRR